MGMGYVPSYGWTISHDHLETLLPAAWTDLQHLLNRHAATLDGLARALEQEAWVSESEEAHQEIRAAFEELYAQFMVATTVGESCLDLELIHYDPELGDRYDQLDPGANWLIGGVRQFSPAGEKLRQQVEWKGWTTFC